MLKKHIKWDIGKTSYINHQKPELATSTENIIFIKYRILVLGGQLKSEQYDTKTAIGWSVRPVFANMLLV